MKVTIKDIAKKAEVSISTVSLVLNNKPCRVAENTRKKIKQIAEKYNYKANQTARSLVTKKSNILGLIIPDIENLFFSALCKQIEEYCRSLGYAIIIVNSNDRKEDDHLLIDLLVSRGVDGIFITVSNESLLDSKSIQKTLSDFTIPYVMVDRVYPEIHCNKVYFDNELGAYLAIKKFVEYGHSKIACVGISEISKNGSYRVVGYRKAMEYFKLPVPESYILDGNYRFQGGYDCGLKLLDSDITAIFVCNDMMTLGLMRCFQEHNKRVPEDISIISYDNTLNPFMQGTEITSIDQNIEKLALTACDILIENIKQPNIEKKTICLEPHLIEKDSVKKL
ncbi:LacI family DNA-binding transcriptional regulator [Clostridium uliginosum]|uniref:LacI family transcriptional regulator n=1 Tax=Clostridium uliginosum TaxID=119641 RepID=A0A1I1RS67_9CLOT|nr:LacI family DNA-binding transcriptional regulator [Clostridium uliginosum]SFD37196.1 LacI family transcriptional regulator [Clostridium uliginosum]